MKKRYFYVLALSVLMAGSACEPLWNKVKVPEPVTVRFMELYPSIKNADWEEEDGNFEAEFTISGQERKALFSADGNLIHYSEELEERYLPEPIRNVLQAQYGTFKVDEAHRVQQNGTATYVVELEDKNKEILLRFDTNGSLLQEQTHTTTPPASPETASLVPAGGLNSNAATTLSEPDARWELPDNLREVSGIAMLSDNLVACVQDEEGAIHLYDLQKKEVVQKINFGGPGDYEAIAVAGNAAYVLRSDGTLFEVADFREGKPVITQHNSVLAKTQDTEGLAYDEANNRLLIACKGFDSKLGEKKGIYTFSLSDKKMQPEPAIAIPLAQKELTSTKKKQKSKYETLQPSSIERHPATGELYLLDAANSRLHIINEQGRIQKTAALDKNQLVQPEGLAFGPDGALYIASEGGKKGKGVIVKYPKGI